jgi:hypothetical protein
MREEDVRGLKIFVSEDERHSAVRGQAAGNGYQVAGKRSGKEGSFRREDRVDRIEDRHRSFRGNRLAGAGLLLVGIIHGRPVLMSKLVASAAT